MYRKPLITAPWGGWIDGFPSITLKPTSFKKITGWLIDKGRLHSFPKLNDFATPTGGRPVFAARTFLDGIGSFHTVVFTNENAYYLTSGPTYTVLGPYSWVKSNSPVSIEVMQNQLFFSNGFSAVKYISGDANYYNARLDNAIITACFFLGKLASHLMMVNCTEPELNQPGSTQFPARVRWSKSGDPHNLTDFTAGFVDLLDVEDQLTGWATIGTTGFAFRNNGITAFSPTGVFNNPFYIENFSIGPTGIGCSYPYTLASFGNFCVFVALDDIYLFDGGAPQAIGTSAKRAIYKDLNSASGQVTATILGSLTQGVDYLTYWLMIPQANNTFTSVWVYHFDDKTWINAQLPYGQLASISNIALS
jgi:hypothetical protein